MAAIVEQHPGATVEVWAQDEQRVGLQPIQRRVWARVRCRPSACGRQRYEWIYNYGFVEPASGRTWFHLWSGVDTDLFERTLAAFCAEQGVDEQRHIVLVMDGAGWHTSLATTPERLPVGLHLIIQPPKSPELQPAERLWPLMNEAVANRSFESLEELLPVLTARCREVADQPAQVQALCGYGWWLDSVAQALGEAA